MSDHASPRRIIGYREWIAIPAWGITKLSAKADTGARTSALDVSNIEELPNGLVRFDLVRHRHHRDRVTTIEAPVARQSRVKSSTGESRERFFVRVAVHLGEDRREIEFSLVNRHGMINRVLLGRAALRGDYLVDAGARHLLGLPTTEGNAS